MKDFAVDSTGVPQTGLKSIYPKVDQLFSKNKEMRGNLELYITSIFFITLFLAPFFTMYSFSASSISFFTILDVIFRGFLSGIGMVGVGTNIMHDAVHGSYSSKRWVNKFLGVFTLAITVASLDSLWKLTHNYMHHTHTNEEGKDGDIEMMPILCMTKYQKPHFVHKFQAYYVLFLYLFVTIFWLIWKDFLYLFKYFILERRPELLKKRLRTNEKIEKILTLFLFKASYVLVWILLPLRHWESGWMFFAFFFTMHFVAGFILALFFAVAHVVPNVETYGGDDKKPDSIIEHQLRTTSNFSISGGFWGWLWTKLSGGLNYQTEHHLFPRVCHVHYPKIASVVQKGSAEDEVPYNSFQTFFGAIKGHIRLLHKLGNPDRYPEVGS